MGDNVVVEPGQGPPDRWAGADRVTVDGGTLDDPAGTVDELQERWAARTPTVIELGVDFAEPPAETFDGPVWRLAPQFSFLGERLWHLVWSNSVDARPGTDPKPRDIGEIDGGPLTPGPAIPVVNAEHGRLLPLRPARSRAELAADQLAAVHHRGGPARIIAPAGSGKTRVLVERARLLLDGWGLTPAALCLVAFNRRAADEIRDRTPDLPGLRIRTLNSLGLAVVNRTGEFADGTPSNRAVIEEGDVRRIIADLVEFPRRTNTDPVAAWVEALGQVRLGLRSPESVEADYGGDVEGFAEFFERYRSVLTERDVLDFDEQIYGAIEQLSTDPVFRHRAQRSCRVLLVDEFQDLTPAHLLLIRQLTAPRYDVYGVGDDDQTIYGYNGADPEWLLNYAAYFPGADAHALEVNYRCPPAVVDRAATLLTHNRRRVDKAIRARPDRDKSDGSLTVAMTGNPTATTLERVTALAQEGIELADLVVLTRVRASLAPVQVGLRSEGVACTAPIGPDFLHRTGVRAALSWLRVATAPDDLRAADLRETVRRPSHGVSPRVVDWMAEHDSIAAIERLARRLRGRDSEKLEGWLDNAKLLSRHGDTDTTSVLLRRLRNQVGLSKATDTLDRSRRQVDRSSHGDDLDALEQLGQLQPDPHRFANWLADSLDGSPGDPSGVLLSTIHRVKGREWPHVIVHGANEGLMPHRLSTDIEEERRIFHVAVTRAINSVLVVADETRPSAFLAELDEEASEESRSLRRGGRLPADEETDRTALPAEVGLEFDHGGYTVTVSAISDDGVTASVGRATMSLPFGAGVFHRGRSMSLVAPALSSTSNDASVPVDDPVDEALREALRTWRRETAQGQGVPAFVVFNDATLDDLVARRPTDEAELMACRGIGPSRVENYGADILAVISEQFS